MMPFIFNFNFNKPQEKCISPMQVDFQHGLETGAHQMQWYNVWSTQIQQPISNRPRLHVSALLRQHDRTSQ
jgi:hypothetical protein